MSDEKTEKTRQELLEKLKGLEFALGCTAEELLSVLAIEIGARLPAQQPQQVDIEQLAILVAKQMPSLDLKGMEQKIIVAIEAKVGVKLDEAMALMNRGLNEAKPNPESIIQGVAAILQPGIAQAAQQAAEAVFMANAKAIQESIKVAMDQRFKELTESAGAGTPATGMPTLPAIPQGSGGMAGGLIQMAMSNPEGLKGLAEVIKAIMEILKPAPVPVNAVLSDFNQKLAFHDLMTKIEKRQASTDDIAKGIAASFQGTSIQSGNAASSK